MVKFSEKSKRCGEIIRIPVNDIQPNPYQPRKVFDWNDLEELAQSIYQNGLLQPVTVRQVCEGQYELVAGERRLKASKMAGLPEIPAIVVNVSEEKSAIYAVIENLQRKDLNFFEEAKAIERLNHNFGMNREKIAKKLGKSTSAISNKLRLLRLPDELQKKIISHGLTERHARAIIRLPETNIMNEVVDAVIENNLNVAETEMLVTRLLEEHPKKEDKPQSRRHSIKVFKDIQLFINTLDHAVMTMRNSGIDANSFHKETETYTEYIVRINKRDVSRETLTK
ncbi:MAG: ParB/RepB/Spo0J family partition protein [Clostridia bacterium]|nr:ParB/RepB/Spo0J family partition protein [Clostridia bacterium]